MHKLPHVPAFFRYYCLFVSVMLRHLFFPCHTPARPEYPKTRQPQLQTDCPIKSGNSRKGKMSENDIVIPPSHAPA